jgi:tight adherence protein C
MQISPETVPLVISTMTFFVTILLFAGLYQVYRQHIAKRVMLDKVRVSTYGEEVLAEGSPMSSGSGQKGFSRLLSSIGRRMAPERSQQYSEVRRRLVRAGIRRASGPTIFWGTKCLLAVLFPAVFFFVGVAFLQPLNPNHHLGISLLLGLAGLYLPDIWLNKRTERRKDKIREGMPDALDLLVVCVEAGMGLDSAMNRVADEMDLSNKTLSEELRLYGLEQRAGKAREDALKHLADRIDMEDVNNLTSLLLQTDRFGTSLAQSLRVYSDTFRTKRFMKAEEKAGKLAGRLLFPLILFIFPSLFVAILGPAAIRIYQTMIQP